MDQFSKLTITQYPIPRLIGARRQGIERQTLKGTANDIILAASLTQDRFEVGLNIVANGAAFDIGTIWIAHRMF